MRTFQYNTFIILSENAHALWLPTDAEAHRKHAHTKLHMGADQNNSQPNSSLRSTREAGDQVIFIIADGDIVIFVVADSDVVILVLVSVLLTLSPYVQHGKIPAWKRWSSATWATRVPLMSPAEGVVRVSTPENCDQVVSLQELVARRVNAQHFHANHTLGVLGGYEICWHRHLRRSGAWRSGARRNENELEQ